jgi:hypothetical protein
MTLAHFIPLHRELLVALFLLPYGNHTSRSSRVTDDGYGIAPATASGRAKSRRTSATLRRRASYYRALGAREAAGSSPSLSRAAANPRRRYKSSLALGAFCTIAREYLHRCSLGVGAFCDKLLNVSRTIAKLTRHERCARESSCFTVTNAGRR